MKLKHHRLTTIITRQIRNMINQQIIIIHITRTLLRTVEISINISISFFKPVKVRVITT